VSALRGLGDDPRYIQITTPIQPGNSGGPLIDSSGHVIGVTAAKLDALNVVRTIGDLPQNINFAIELGTLKLFLQAYSVRTTEAPSTGDLAPADIGDRAKLFTYLIECRTPPASTPTETQGVPPPRVPDYADAPAPSPSTPPRPIPIDVRKLKWSDVRQPYSSIRPEIFEMNITNTGSDRVTELTIGFMREKHCSRNFEDYDGLKRFTTNLQPGDSVTLTGEFSAQAKSFCIVTALGPPEGLSACANSAVPIDVAMAACNRVIESGQVVGNALGLAYASRGNLDDRRGDHDRAIADILVGLTSESYKLGQSIEALIAGMSEPAGIII
jgi:hypothetical protein